MYYLHTFGVGTWSPQIIVVATHVPTSYYLHAFGVGTSCPQRPHNPNNVPTMYYSHTFGVGARGPHKSLLWVHTSSHHVIYMHSVWVPLARNVPTIQTTSPQCTIYTHSVWGHEPSTNHHCGYTRPHILLFTCITAGCKHDLVFSIKNGLDGFGMVFDFQRGSRKSATVRFHQYSAGRSALHVASAPTTIRAASQ